MIWLSAAAAGKEIRECRNYEATIYRNEGIWLLSGGTD
jgi:hypothetical protein